MKTQRRYRKTGWTLMGVGLVAGVGFWMWLVPVVEGTTPDFSPHLSPQGFWQAKERALKLGFWRHDDGAITGAFGGKNWVEKIIGWLREGKEIGSCSEGHRDIALAAITNHEVPGGPDFAAEWQRWWEVNRGRTQEEWIQQGFAENGVSIMLPPSKEDWRKLLGVLGAAAGPSQQPSREVKMLYADHVRYNAYRWLRDSGFDPLALAMSDEAKNLSVEQWAGLRAYPRQETMLYTPPPPGRLAFALKEDWGQLGLGPDARPVFLNPLPQAGVTMVSVLLILGGWKLARSKPCLAVGAGRVAE